MNIEIDLTDLNAEKITFILKRFPLGHLEIKSSRVYWVSEFGNKFEPKSLLPNSSPQNTPIPPANPFERMGDVLSQMVG